MICLRDLMRFCIRARLKRFSACVFPLLLLIVLMTPVASTASTNQKAEEAINLLEQKEYALAIDILHELEKSIVNPDQISNLLAFAYLGCCYELFCVG